MQDEAVVFYAPGRGLMEPARLLLDFTQTPWRDFLIDSAEVWNELKSSGRLPFGQFPALEIDGFVLAEVQAIFRYIATTRGIAGQNARQTAIADMLASRIWSLRRSLAFRPFLPDPEAELGRILTKEVATCLDPLEAWLSRNATDAGLAVGASITYADLLIYECLDWLGELSPETVEARPHLDALRSVVGKDARVRRFMTSDRHYPQPDDAYVAKMQAAAAG